MTSSAQINTQDDMVADALKGSWVHRYLPRSIWPYAQLARWERPIGWKLLMWPCWWSFAMALGWGGYDGTREAFSDAEEAFRWIAGAAWFLFLFFVGAFTMRGAGCTYNDLVDVDIDARVARTRSRPLPSGRVTKKQAAAFLLVQLFIGLVILLQFNCNAIFVGVASLVTVAIYPFMKRITWWPQLFLGLAFSWGALMGWTALEEFYLNRPLALLPWPPILLYLGCICWVIAYDTIYAHQDIEDDALVGVKSTARLFAENTRPALASLYGAAILLWAAAFYSAGMSWIAWLALAGAGAHLVSQVVRFEFDQPALALRLFKSNNTVGWLLFAGLFAAALLPHLPID